MDTGHEKGQVHSQSYDSASKIGGSIHPQMPLQALPIPLGLVQSLYAVDDDLERGKPLGQFFLNFLWWRA